MNKIIVNGRFLLHRVTGVERYAREILAELDKMINHGEIEIAIPKDVKKIPDYKNIVVTRVGCLSNRMWEHISFPLYVKKKKGISLNLCNVAPLPSPGIVCIHDVKIKATPQYFSKKFLLWYSMIFFNAVKRSRIIVTVSEFSKKELCRYYHILPEKVYVVPNAWQHYTRTNYDENTLQKYKLKKDNYCFSMCSLEPNKNFKWIAEVAKRNKNIVFAISGSINKNVFSEGLGFACPENMKLLGYVSDEEAKTLMRDCKYFIFPTFYEGFGIPPLEAISAGSKDVLVSDTEVMHEIFGDSVTYIDPLQYDYDFESSNYNTISNTNVLDRYSWYQSADSLKQLIYK